MSFDVDRLLANAFEAHKQGDLTQAEETYRRILTLNAQHVDANQLLGALLSQDKRPAEAIEYIRRAIAVNPGVSIYHCNLGIALSRSGQKEAAVAAYRHALLLQANNVEAAKNLGILLLKLGRLGESIPLLEQAIEFKPSCELHLNLGLAFYKAGRHDDAERQFDEALKLEPNNRHALAGLGQTLLNRKKMPERAVACWQRLVELDPDNVALWNNLATTLKKLNKLDESVEACRRALELEPDYFPALCNFGLALGAQGHFAESREQLRKAIGLSADFKHAIVDGQPQAGLVDLAMWKEFASVAYNQLAAITNMLGDEAEAHACVAQALAMNEEDVDAHMMRGFLYLQRGEFQKGWPDYEWRRRGEYAPRRFPGREWKGETAREATILIHAEQGLGDSIQFIRYARLVRERTGRVVFLTRKPLFQLMQQCSYVDQVAIEGETLPAFDMHVPLMSLPGVFETSLETVPRQVPYLGAAPELVAYWREKLADIDGIRVGIAWQGNRDFAHDSFRRVPLKCFGRLAKIPGVELISLQCGDGTEQLADIDFPVHVFDEVDTVNGPFMDTAAIMSNIDLVISPCTATPHLAGALGVPVWLAKSLVAEWRWMAEDRESNPWYPTMRMFRQPALLSWEPVFERMSAEIEKLIHEKLANSNS